MTLLIKALLRGRFLFLIPVLLVLTLTGCQTTSGQLAALEDAWKLSFTSDKLDTSKLPKQYEYLLVHGGVKPTLMGLGKRTVTQTTQGEAVDEFWFSVQGELLVLRNGRIHSVFGLPIEWRSNLSSPPNWQQTLSSSEAITWLRVRDEMPNYRFGIPDKISTLALASAPTLDNIATELAPKQSNNIKWVQDKIETSDHKGQLWLFKQVFAIEQNQMIYSEQCISSTYCLRILRIKH